MIDVISLVSSIITIMMFVLYFIGHCVKNISKSLLMVENIIDDDQRNLEDIQDDKNIDYAIDLSSENIGETIQISSDYGMRKLSIIEIEFCEKSGKYIEKGVLYTLDNIPANKIVYIQKDFGEVTANTMLKIERYDYTVVEYKLYSGARNRHIIFEYCKPKHNLKSILYYISA